MPVTKCVVDGCGSSGPNAVLFSLPRSRDLRGVWLQLLAPHASQLQGKLPSDARSQKVCVAHFESKHLRTGGPRPKKDRSACPTLFTRDEIESGRPNVAVKLNDTKIQEEHSYCSLNNLGHDHTYSKESKNIITLAHSSDTNGTNEETSDGATKTKQQEATKKPQDVDDWMEYNGVKEKSRSRQDNQAACSNDFKDLPINLEEGIDPSCLDPEFDEPPTEAIFSWQKEEILYPIEDTDVLMAVKRSDQLQDVEDLSLYDDEDNERITNEVETHKEAEYQCNVCEQKIIGFHYTCVQCADFDLCGACEANGAHNAHYVLRVPKDRPYNEIQTVLAAIRQQLLAENLFLMEQITEDDVKSEPEEDLRDHTRPEEPGKDGEGGPDDPLRRPNPDRAEAPIPSRSDDEYSDGSEYKPPRRKRRRFLATNNTNSDSDSDSNSDSSAVTTISAQQPQNHHKAKKKPETRSALKHPVHGTNIFTDLSDRQPVDVFDSTQDNGLASIKIASISQTHDSYSTGKSLTATSVDPIETMELDPLESLVPTGPHVNQLDDQTENNDLLELPGTIYEAPGDIEDLDAILEIPDDVTVVVHETPHTPSVAKLIDSGEIVCDVRNDGVLHLRVPADTNDEALAQALYSKAHVALQPLVIQYVISDR